MKPIYAHESHSSNNLSHKKVIILGDKLVLRTFLGKQKRLRNSPHKTFIENLESTPLTMNAKCICMKADKTMRYIQEQFDG